MAPIINAGQATATLGSNAMMAGKRGQVDAGIKICSNEILIE